MSTGWTVRNFVESGFLSKLAKKANVTIVLNQSVYRALDNYEIEPEVEVVRLDIPLSEPKKWKLVRQFKKKLQQNILNSSTELIWKKYVSRPAYQKIAGNLIDLILTQSVCRLLLRAIERLELLVNQNALVREEFSDKRFDTVFFTNLSNYFDDSFSNYFARFKKINRFFMVLSWDHVSSKVVLRTDFDKVFVWNQVSKEEIITLDIGYTESTVIVVGVPQYESYKFPPLITRESWLEKFHLDPRIKVILFCTIPQGRTNDQHLKIEALVARIRTSSECYAIVLKIHPLDDVSVYWEVVSKNRDIVKFEREYNVNWIPSGNEIEETKNSLCFSDVIVNTFSTITIEAAILDRPIIHIAYDKNEVENRIPCFEYYNFHHFKPIVQYDATTLVYSDDQLFSAIKHNLEAPQLKKKRRARLAQGYFDKSIDSLDALVNEFF